MCARQKIHPLLKAFAMAANIATLCFADTGQSVFDGIVPDSGIIVQWPKIDKSADIGCVLHCPEYDDRPVTKYMYWIRLRKPAPIGTHGNIGRNGAVPAMSQERSTGNAATVAA